MILGSSSLIRWCFSSSKSAGVRLIWFSVSVFDVGTSLVTCGVCYSLVGGVSCLKLHEPPFRQPPLLKKQQSRLRWHIYLKVAFTAFPKALRSISGKSLSRNWVSIGLSLETKSRLGYELGTAFHSIFDPKLLTLLMIETVLDPWDYFTGNALLIFIYWYKCNWC